jgi:hypothetical protein
LSAVLETSGWAPVSIWTSEAEGFCWAPVSIGTLEAEGFC